MADRDRQPNLEYHMIRDSSCDHCGCGTGVWVSRHDPEDLVAILRGAAAAAAFVAVAADESNCACKNSAAAGGSRSLKQP